MNTRPPPQIMISIVQILWIWDHVVWTKGEDIVREMKYHTINPNIPNGIRVRWYSHRKVLFWPWLVPDYQTTGHHPMLCSYTRTWAHLLMYMSIYMNHKWWSGGIRDRIPQWSRPMVDPFWLSISMDGSVYGILGLTLWYLGAWTPTIITSTDPWFHSMGSDHHTMRSSDRGRDPEHGIPKSWISRVGQEWPHGGDPVDFHQQCHSWQNMNKEWPMITACVIMIAFHVYTCESLLV